MQEKTLSNISLLTSIIGICGLFILSFFVNYDLVAIGDINSAMEGKTVRIEGEILSITAKEQVSLLKIKDETGEINVISFTDKDISIREKNLVEVIGTISNYNGNLEIKAEKISSLVL